ncbi:hypothetical protein BHE90_017613, partial [Fusarium euwallaceae]
MERRDSAFSVESDDEQVSLVCEDVLLEHPFDFLVLVPRAEQELEDRRSRVVPWVHSVYAERQRLGHQLDDDWWRSYNPDGFIFEMLYDVVTGLELSGDFVRAKPQTEELVTLRQTECGRCLTYGHYGACKRI